MSISHFPPPLARPRVKICGLTRQADVRQAHALGADFFGLILTPKSPRQIQLEAARHLVETMREELDEDLRFVGVFVDEPLDFILERFEALNLFAIQHHGDPSPLMRTIPPSQIIIAKSIRDREDATRLVGERDDLGAVLADAFVPGLAGGTGKVFDHALVQPLFPQRRVFVAGGLNPDNIVGIIQALQPGPMPYAIDLSSGLEAAPGQKDPAKMAAFFAAFEAVLGAPPKP